MKKETGGPDFMVAELKNIKHDGMTLRQYAAIKLRVPDSGNDWLDEMIRQSLRDEFAAKAMQAMLAHPDSKETASPQTYASAAYTMADAMVARK
jgi:hypothetical protein